MECKIIDDDVIITMSKEQALGMLEEFDYMLETVEDLKDKNDDGEKESCPISEALYKILKEKLNYTSEIQKIIESKYKNYK